MTGLAWVVVRVDVRRPPQETPSAVPGRRRWWPRAAGLCAAFLETSPAGFAANCAAVFQDSARYRCPVREERAPGGPRLQSDDAAPLAAAERAGVGERPRRLPKGVDTLAEAPSWAKPVGKHGAGSPAGRSGLGPRGGLFARRRGRVGRILHHRRREQRAAVAGALPDPRAEVRYDAQLPRPGAPGRCGVAGSEHLGVPPEPLDRVRLPQPVDALAIQFGEKLLQRPRAVLGGEEPRSRPLRRARAQNVGSR